MSELITEPDEIEKRKTNLMVGGMPEDSETNDTFLVQQLGEALQVTGIFERAKRVFRVGEKKDNRTRPRPIKIVCSDESDKVNVLKVAKKLKDVPAIGLAFKPTDVFLGPDQTSIQRERAYQARVRKRQVKDREPRPPQRDRDAPKN